MTIPYEIGQTKSEAEIRKYLKDILKNWGFQGKGGKCCTQFLWGISFPVRIQWAPKIKVYSCFAEADLPQKTSGCWLPMGMLLAKVCLSGSPKHTHMNHKYLQTLWTIACAIINTEQSNAPSMLSVHYWLIEKYYRSEWLGLSLFLKALDMDIIQRHFSRVIVSNFCFYTDTWNQLRLTRFPTLPFGTKDI